MGGTRKPVSSKMRFEVFKRDSFTCQYCGAKAPDVVLHADHVSPVAAGGRNTMMNLVTACAACNGGKGARFLSDGSAVEKSRKQAEAQQERIAQIRMMAKWQEGLAKEKEEMVKVVVRWWITHTGFGPNEVGRTAVRGWLSLASLAEVLEASAVSCAQYLNAKSSARDPWEVAFEKVPGVIKHRRIERAKPHHGAIMYTKGIIRNRFGQPDYGFYAQCEAAILAGLSPQLLKDFAKSCDSIDGFYDAISGWSD